MAIRVDTIKRQFKYNGIVLADLDPSASVERIKSMYAPAYPELSTSLVDGPVEKNGVLEFEFRRAVGTKGNK